MLPLACRPQSAEPRKDRVYKRVPLPNGAARRESYDFLGRLHSIEEPDLNRRLSCRWDKDSQGLEVSDAHGLVVAYSGNRARTTRTETIIEVDDSGLPRGIVQRVDGNEWHIELDRESVRYPQSTAWLHFHRDGPDLVVRCDSQPHVVGRGCVKFSTGAVIKEAIAERIQRIEHYDRDGIPIVDVSYQCDDRGRIILAADEAYEYDSEDRLARAQTTEYRYDCHDRLTHFQYEGVAPMVAASGSTIFSYDGSGRRTRKDTPSGPTTYEYDGLGQLCAVHLPAGETIRYIHDGFGRLVARESSNGTTYFVVDLQGKRLAEANGAGCITRSFLWLGAQCVAAVDGTIDQPLTLTFHRIHAGRLAAIGDSRGRLHPVRCSDPFGADSPIEHGVPGYACLFGDPETGLLFAGSRWLDPAIAQFITPDTWFGRDAAQFLPPKLRPIARAMPGGPGRRLTPSTAYNWCAFDPVNRIDPNGHSWYGLVLSFISAFLWEMQLTSISLQMEVINIVLEIPALIFGSIFASFQSYKNFSIFNGSLPMASSRLNVPFAIPLNGLLRFHDRGWTLGNVIWVRGAKWRSVDRSNKRDLLACANAATYVASTEEAAVDVYRARSPFTKATATATAAQLTGVALTLPAAPVVHTDVFSVNTWISIRKPGEPTDEIRQIDTIAGATYNLKPPALPAGLFGPVEITRLDSAIVKIAKDDSLIARSITFIRGTSVHFSKQIPEGFPLDGLTVTEYMPSGKANSRQADSHKEFPVIRLAAAADLAGFAPNDFVRIRNGSTYFARTVGRKRGSRDLILADPLPVPAASVSYEKVEIVKLDGGATAAAQTAAGDRVNAGNLVDLRKFDGLTIENTGAVAPVAVTSERRIVLSLLLDCQVASLPNAVQGAPITPELITPDASKQADGTNTAPTVITTTAGQAGRFDNKQWVRVRKAPSTDAFTKITIVNSAANTITLADPLDAATFPNGTAVTVTLLAAGRKLKAENVSAPGDHIKVITEDPTELHLDDILRVSLQSNSDTAAVRKIAVPPTVVAVVDGPMPPSHVAGLTVRRFSPVAATLHPDASAPTVQLRFTVRGAPPPYVAGDTVLLQGGEEAWGTVVAAPAGQDILLTDPVEYLLDPIVTIRSITSTGITTPSANLDESRILIPSDPDAEPITHREAFEQHEMRHVFQGALWGPFLLSLPLPWLFNLGFSFGDSASSKSKIMRNIGLGGLDSLFALAVLGVGNATGHAPSSADVVGTLGPDRKVVTFPPDAPADAVAAFTKDSPIEISKGDFSTFNVVDQLDTNARILTLRFALGQDKFSPNDQVGVHASAFEKIRKTINTWFSLNLEELWSQHIPAPWGRVLSQFLNRDSWFPLGIYPLSLLAAGFDEDRLPNEQDAAYHSGDLYTDILIARPNEIFVGQFSAIFGFLDPRHGGDEEITLSQNDPRFGNPVTLLTVELPAGVTADRVAGSIPEGPNRVRFRENWLIPLSEKVENAVGAFFATAAPGEYILHSPGELPVGKEIVFSRFAFDVGFLKSRKLTVNSLTVTPNTDAANPVFETEEVLFQIGGDSTAEYRIRYSGAAPAPAATLSGLRFTAPLLPADIVHNLEITATYRDTHPVFHGPSQLPAVKLTADQHTNLCQALTVNLKVLTLPAVAAVRAGTKVDFVTPIAARSIRVTSPLPAGAAVPARVIAGTGRPAQNTFFAPNAVTAATNVALELVFGTAPNRRVLNMNINVTP